MHVAPTLLAQGVFRCALFAEHICRGAAVTHFSEANTARLDGDRGATHPSVSIEANRALARLNPRLVVPIRDHLQRVIDGAVFDVDGDRRGELHGGEIDLFRLALHHEPFAVPVGASDRGSPSAGTPIAWRIRLAWMCSRFSREFLNVPSPRSLLQSQHASRQLAGELSPP